MDVRRWRWVILKRQVIFTIRRMWTEFCHWHGCNHPDEHKDFWQAVERTNAELESDGLYLTHLFREVDVILQPDWIIYA